MFKREIESGSPYVYSLEEASYIYDIEFNALKKACANKGISQITKENIFEVFKEIPFGA
jgi:hypothetical protein